MSVKSYPSNTPDLVGTLTDGRGPSMGWQPPLDPATVLPMAEHDLEVGKRVEALRRQKGWSREALAFRAQVSNKTVERIEKGQVEGRRGTIRAIADALEADEYTILGEPVTPAGVPLSDQLEQVVAHFSGQVNAIEERQKDIVRALADRVEHDKHVTELLDRQEQLLDDIRKELLEKQTKLLEDIRKLVELPEGTTIQDYLVQKLRDTDVRDAGDQQQPPSQS